MAENSSLPTSTPLELSQSKLDPQVSLEQKGWVRDGAGVYVVGESLSREVKAGGWAASQEDVLKVFGALSAGSGLLDLLGKK